MSTAAHVVVALVALLHAYFLVLEMFLWTTPFGRRTFHNSVEKAEATRVLAANQGLYNGFLAAGLLWGLWLAEPMGSSVQLFFLGCVIVAGVYGAMTVSRRILVIQALPAVIGVALIVASR